MLSVPFVIAPKITQTTVIIPVISVQMVLGVSLVVCLVLLEPTLYRVMKKPSVRIAHPAVVVLMEHFSNHLQVIVLNAVLTKQSVKSVRRDSVPTKKVNVSNVFLAIAYAAMEMMVFLRIVLHAMTQNTNAIPVLLELTTQPMDV